MPKKPKKFIQTKKNDKSPSNSRIITEQKKNSLSWQFFVREWKVIAASFFSGLLMMAIVYTVVDIYQQAQVLEQNRQERVILMEEMQKWETIVVNHPDYRDGYYQLAIYAYQVGETEKARQSLDKALDIDPNFKKAREFKREVGRE